MALRYPTPHPKMSSQGQLGVSSQHSALGTGSRCRGYRLWGHLCSSQNLLLGQAWEAGTSSVTTGLTTEMLASPMEGVAPALHSTSSPWHTDMAAVRLDGCVAPLTSVRPLPQAAAATSQKKVKETVTQKSWEEQRDRKCNHTP